MGWEITIRLAEVGTMVTLCTLAYRGIRAINRLAFLLENFPPHLHSGKEIIYPSGLQPGVSVHMPMHNNS